MKSFILFISIIFSIPTFASDISGKFSHDGNTLEFSILDSAAAYPFEAGRLWDLLKGAANVRSLSAYGLDINCERLSGTSVQDYFGKCKIVANTKNLQNNRDHLVFVLQGSQGVAMNSLFSYEPYSTGLDAGSGHELIITIDRRHDAFSMTFKKSAIK